MRKPSMPTGTAGSPISELSRLLTPASEKGVGRGAVAELQRRVNLRQRCDVVNPCC